MHLGILAALPEEAFPLGFPPHTPQGEIVELANGVLLCVSGMGAGQARTAGQRLLERGANALLSWGTAAALDNRLRPGHVLLPATVLDADRLVVTVSHQWHEQLREQFSHYFSVCTRPLVEADQILTLPAQKRELFERSGAACADMESAALGKVAGQAGVPFVVIRTISDTANMTLPVWISRNVDTSGRLQTSALVLSLLIHPLDWPRVIRLAHGFNVARRSLSALAGTTRLIDLNPQFSC